MLRFIHGDHLDCIVTLNSTSPIAVVGLLHSAASIISGNVKDKERAEYVNKERFAQGRANETSLFFIP
jgi:uncharacterized membrane protein